MAGTTISVISVSCLAMQSFPWTQAAVLAILQALIPALLMNISIVGLNQVFDVEIDKVNKPYLPLASGEFSMTTGM
jgi:homogentisate phytyltransferase/homogentisate geranylgeranyltransferase